MFLANPFKHSQAAAITLGASTTTLLPLSRPTVWSRPKSARSRRKCTPPLRPSSGQPTCGTRLTGAPPTLSLPLWSRSCSRAPIAKRKSTSSWSCTCPCSLSSTKVRESILPLKGKGGTFTSHASFLKLTSL